MADQSLMSRVGTALMPAVAKRIFPSEWLEAGNDGQRLLEIAKKRRSGDGPRPDLVLERSWSRATTQVGSRDLHLFTPKAGSTGRVLFYCHGGAFVVGPSSVEWLFVSRLAKAIGCDFALYDYPKVPEVDTNVIRETTLAAYRVIAERYDNVVIVGTSAGGGLAVSTMLQIHRDGAAMPVAAGLISPWLDVTGSHPDIGDYAESDKLLNLTHLRRDGELYAGSTDATSALVSPRFASAGELAALPPTVVTAGAHEILLPEAREFVNNLGAAGTTAKLAIEAHGQHVGVLVATREAKPVVAECAAFLRAQLAAQQ